MKNLVHSEVAQKANNSVSISNAVSCFSNRNSCHNPTWREFKGKGSYHPKAETISVLSEALSYERTTLEVTKFNQYNSLDPKVRLFYSNSFEHSTHLLNKSRTLGPKELYPSIFVTCWTKFWRSTLLSNDMKWHQILCSVVGFK